jgi:hypothetical protein
MLQTSQNIPSTLSRNPYIRNAMPGQVDIQYGDLVFSRMLKTEYSNFLIMTQLHIYIYVSAW